MNDMETAPSHSAPAASGPAQEHAVDFNRYLRRCGLVFAAALCMISLMVAASFAPIGGWPVKVAVILTIACANALAQLYSTGLPPASYPQPPSAYVYGASQRQVIGPQ